MSDDRWEAADSIIDKLPAHGYPPMVVDRERLRVEVARVMDRALQDVAAQLNANTAATKDLVVASNSNTTTMATLQRWVIGLTAVYVVLTAVLVGLSFLKP